MAFYLERGGSGAPEFDAKTQSIPSLDKSGLWHYSGFDLYQSLLKNPCLRATHYSCLQDQTEYRRCLDVYRSTFLTIWGDLPEDDDVRRSARALLDIVEQGDIYIVCFTSAKDDKEMWEAYCPGDVGQSIGFNYRQFDECFPSDVMWSKVRYETEEELKSYCEGHWKAIRDGGDVAHPIDSEKWGESIARTIQRIALNCITSKSIEGYSWEREWRLMRFVHQGQIMPFRQEVQVGDEMGRLSLIGTGWKSIQEKSRYGKNGDLVRYVDIEIDHINELIIDVVESPTA